MKKLRSQLKELERVLANADVDVLMYFDEVWWRVWADEQLRSYSPLDEVDCRGLRPLQLAKKPFLEFTIY